MGAPHGSSCEAVNDSLVSVSDSIDFRVGQRKRFARDSFKFKKRCQLIIRVHDKSLPVVAMRVSNEGRSPVGIHSCDAAPTPSGFAQIASDDFPVLHKSDIFSRCS